MTRTKEDTDARIAALLARTYYPEADRVTCHALAHYARRFYFEHPEVEILLSAAERIAELSDRVFRLEEDVRWSGYGEDI